MIEKKFEGIGDFDAYWTARQWCVKNGISCGSMNRDKPIGLIWGDFIIAKWKNLTQKERDELDGTMTSEDFRNGSVTVRIKEKA